MVLPEPIVRTAVVNFIVASSWKGSGGFSVNADVQIEESDRRGAERLIRYCANPVFSGEKLTLLSAKAEIPDSIRFEYDVSKHSQKAKQSLAI